MNLIKVDAIASTNTTLKEMARDSQLENFTTLYTDNQTSGRGQVNSKWESEPNKNLTFSVFIKDIDFTIEDQFLFNQMISIIIQEFINDKVEAKINIKWPNDILADKKKICGILIENAVSNSKIKHVIVGVGLNVNQEEFLFAPNATSLKLLGSKDFDLDLLIKELVSALESGLKSLLKLEKDQLYQRYIDKLFKFNTPAMFSSNGEKFMGKIIGIGNDGKLQLEKDDELVFQYDIKEIQFL